LRFYLGKIVMSKAITKRMAEDARFARFVKTRLERHSNCNWGNISRRDREANDFAVINGEPVFSTYGVKNKIWIVTIPAKKVTLVLFPSDRS
jgi:hypothetical protein